MLSQRLFIGSALFVKDRRDFHREIRENICLLIFPSNLHNRSACFDNIQNRHFGLDFCRNGRLFIVDHFRINVYMDDRMCHTSGGKNFHHVYVFRVIRSDSVFTAVWIHVYNEMAVADVVSVSAPGTKHHVGVFVCSDVYNSEEFDRPVPS